MVGLVICLGGVLGLLILDDILASAKILKVESRRKFAHIAVGVFVASWPWLISWRTIQAVATAMLLVVAINNRRTIFKFNKGIARKSYGDYFFALGILASAGLSSSKVFFMIAMLHLGLADAMGALIGSRFGFKWRYKVFNHTKTVIGSMAIWVTSLIILGVGVLFAHELISFSHYLLLLVVLPPLITALENISVYGLDNLVIPVVVVIALQIAQNT
jgi:phytol kinase